MWHIWNFDPSEKGVKYPDVCRTFGSWSAGSALQKALRQLEEGHELKIFETAVQV